MDHQLVITSSPHFRAPTTTSVLMRDVLISLCPALAAAVWFFGPRALLLTAVSVAGCVLFEYLYNYFMKNDQTIADCSAAVTGVLLAFNLPVTMPFWQALVGCFAAIIVVKQLFGGIGRNFANPAIVGRIVLFISFSTNMTKWMLPVGLRTADAVTSATPLVLAANAAVTSATRAAVAPPSYLQLFLGNIGGSMGETCKLALLIGGLYLIIRKVISPTIPLVFIATVAALSALWGADPLYQILSGGLFLGAFFMATDYVTSPTTERGKIIFAFGAGLITVVIRLFAAYPEGVSFAILLMNLATPLIDRYTPVKAFGGAAK